jgi:hypothetical protein
MKTTRQLLGSAGASSATGRVRRREPAVVGTRQKPVVGVLRVSNAFEVPREAHALPIAIINE